MSTRLFVGNLPYNATEADLREHFRAIGPLSYIYLPTDRETGRPRGFAFVEFIERAEAEEAIRRLNNQPFMGRPIAVSEARAKAQQSAPRPPITSRPVAPPLASERSFGPDDAPRRTRKQPRSASKTQRVPKGPIRERTSGPVSFDDDDSNDFYDDTEEENFASRASLSDDDMRSEEL
ncbi:MAG TPA: RNA-binding protein [Blastocatellia bacterium]|jgi:RNA recognition motif-containing protein